MVILTGFADEISPELDVQLDVLQSEQISYLEFRGVWGKNVLKLTDEELDQVAAELDKRGVKISSIGSPIGKIGIKDDFEPHLQDFERALYVAKKFAVPYIRIFSFFIPEGEDAALYRDEVIRRLRVITQRAAQEKVVLLHENEKEIYGDTAERCLDILESINSPYLRCAFDPANFVQCGVKPFTEAYPILEPYLEYMHIKDALFEQGKVVPAGEGDGQVAQVLQALQEQKYQGFMSLEPHLAAAETFSGFSGPDLFVVASQALKKILAEQGQEWK